MDTIFWLVRHGETAWNTERRLQGWQDLPLSPAGIAQAQRLADWLTPSNFHAPVERILSSDLIRAQQTADIACVHLGLPVEPLRALRERHFGSYEGQYLDSMHDADGAPIRFHALDKGMEGGESLADFRQRIRDAFDLLARQYPSRHLLVFSHGGVIDMVWRLATGTDPSAPGPRPIINTSINQFAIDARGNWALGQWGCCDHLDESDESVGRL